MKGKRYVITLARKVKNKCSKLLHPGKKLELDLKNTPYKTWGKNWKGLDKPVALAFGFSIWKREFISEFFPEYRLAYVSSKTSLTRLRPYINHYKDVVFLIWSYKEEAESLEHIIEFAKEHSIKLIRVEDGFVRSVKLGAGHQEPLSLVADDHELYFNSRNASSLENLLNTYDFSGATSLITRSKSGMKKLKSLGISKYNHVQKRNIEEIYGEKKKKRVLVIGQVEDDASIKYGSDIKLNNNDLVWAAYNENRDAQIIYKPHPDVLSGQRDFLSDPKQVEHIALVLKEPISLVDSLETIDHVYTITSLSGFEALMRGIKVTCFGAPFYSGWGLTDDRQYVNRRKRSLTIEELFAGAYLLYPRYIDYSTKSLTTFEEAVSELTFQMAEEAYKSEDYKSSVELLLELSYDEKFKFKALKKLTAVSKISKNYNDYLHYCQKAIEAADTLKEKSDLAYDKIVFMYQNKILEFKGDELIALCLDGKLSHNKKMKLVNIVWEIEGVSDKLLEVVEQLVKVPDLSANQALNIAAIFYEAGRSLQAQKLYNRVKGKNKSEMVFQLYPNLYRLISSNNNSLSGSENTVTTYQQLVDLQFEFEKRISESNGNIAIVGNEGALSAVDSQVISTSDLIIRFNDFNNYGVSNARTDIWINNLNHLYTNNIEFTIVTGNNLFNRGHATSFLLKDPFLSDKKYTLVPKNIYYELIALLGEVPSDYQVIIYWIYKIQGYIESDTIFGIAQSEQNKLQLKQRNYISV